ncbi:alpha-tocopherol transfer protein-like [Mya arenaria]|uniref:alpha-tocopherol transfer protein-like n=1 Tax=Mya arenaria TaxID=6604 RepID=UPI0022E91504|nr:alpha-tocopherol transfer protein-like [Mya arenaria]
MDQTPVECSETFPDCRKTEVDVKEETDALRDWIIQQPEIPNFIESRVLAAFLNVCKFNQTNTRERLRRYWVTRRDGILQHLNDLDPASPVVLEILRGPHAVYVPLPGRDKEGRRVILARWNELDVSGVSYTFEEWFRAISVVFDVVSFMDETSYRNGITILMDAKGVRLAHLLFFGYTNSCKQVAMMQKGYPIRIRQVHYINNSRVIDIFLRIVKKVLSQKLANRIALHGTKYEKLFQHVDVTCLPDNYIPASADSDGTGVGSIHDIKERFVHDELLAPRTLTFLRELYSARAGQDEPCPRNSGLKLEEKPAPRDGVLLPGEETPAKPVYDECDFD